MKTIAMIRHAKSSWATGISSDKLRPLNDRGVRDAPIMASHLQNLLPTIHYLAVSSATRTRETAHHFQRVYGADIAQTQYHDQLYHGMPQDYETLLYTLDSSINTVAMIGHNPGMTVMANLAASDEYIDNVATCGIFLLRTEIDSWTDFAFSECTLQSYIYPKMYV
jgi:phosphohistidine phosphatase